MKKLPPISVYPTSDGKNFPTEGEAEIHELSLELLEAVENYPYEPTVNTVAKYILENYFLTPKVLEPQDPSSYWGYQAGDTCNREGCNGLIEEYDRELCTCHINPPCESCTAGVAYCPICGWEDEGA